MRAFKLIRKSFEVLSPSFGKGYQYDDETRFAYCFKFCSHRITHGLPVEYASTI